MNSPGGTVVTVVGKVPGQSAMMEEEIGLTHLVQHVPCVLKLLQAGVTEPSDSPRLSAVVMVPKKSGGCRLCLDNWPLNGVTKKDLYPLPCIDEFLDLVTSSSQFSSLGLGSGYHQVPLSQGEYQNFVLHWAWALAFQGPAIWTTFEPPFSD